MILLTTQHSHPVWPLPVRKKILWCRLHWRTVLPTLDYPAAYPAFAEAARETEPATDSDTLTQTLEGLGDTLI